MVGLAWLAFDGDVQRRWKTSIGWGLLANQSLPIFVRINGHCSNQRTRLTPLAVSRDGEFGAPTSSLGGFAPGLPTKHLVRRSMANSIQAMLSAAVLLVSGVFGRHLANAPVFFYPPDGSQYVYNKLDTVMVTYTAFYENLKAASATSHSRHGSRRGPGLRGARRVAGHVVTEAGRPTHKSRGGGSEGAGGGRSMADARTASLAGSGCATRRRREDWGFTLLAWNWTPLGDRRGMHREMAAA
jgi:hypothetical protein